MTPLFQRLAEATRGRVAGVPAMHARVPFWLRELGVVAPEAVVVKVTGTNGKGSVCAMLSACLSRAGQDVGTFTGPHLARFTERFAWNGVEVPEQALAPWVERVLGAIERTVATHGEPLRPSLFEALLFVALAFFGERRARVVVLEGGIGGASDAVSHVPGPVTVLTTVALDHAERLGPTLDRIARDKAAMATPGTHLVLGPHVSSALESALREVAAQRRLQLVRERGRGIRLVPRGLSPWDAQIQRGELRVEVPLPLRGRHQEGNLGAVLAALEVLSALGVPSDLAGLANVVWPGRLEVLSGDPTVLLDVAHNAQGMEALAATLDELAPYRSRVLLYGASADKDYPACLPWLSALAPELHLAGGFHRAEQVEVLARVRGDGAVDSFGEPISAIETLCGRLRGSGRLLVVTGSLYLVGAVRAALASRGC
jgi:dihydrofolate synthase/folylpolyglutamate synthase